MKTIKKLIRNFKLDSILRKVKAIARKDSSRFTLFIHRGKESTVNLVVGRPMDIYNALLTLAKENESFEQVILETAKDLVEDKISSKKMTKSKSSLDADKLANMSSEEIAKLSDEEIDGMLSDLFNKRGL